MFKVRTNYYVCKARYQEGVKACPSLQIPIHETSYAIAYMLGSWMPNDINTPKIAPDVSLLIKEKEALEDALPSIKDKTRLIIKINALDTQIKQLIQSSDDRLVPMSYSVEMMVDLCAKIWTSKRHQITTQMYMAIRPHLLRVVNKIVIDGITYIKSSNKSAYRNAVVYAYDGAQVDVLINLPIQGDNNNVRWAQAIAGSNIFKIVD